VRARVKEKENPSKCNVKKGKFPVRPFNIFVRRSKCEESLLLRRDPK
jgi:hypothetical protein